jgi:hypothetical protein
LEIDLSLEEIQNSLNQMIAGEPWDLETRSMVKTWLKLQGIDNLVPSNTQPDGQIKIAIVFERKLYFLNLQHSSSG